MVVRKTIYKRKPFSRKKENKFGKPENKTRKVLQGSVVKKGKEWKKLLQKVMKKYYRGGELHEGTYGCAFFHPALRCEVNKHVTDLDQYVSKLMTRKNAEQEMEEYKVIDSIDPGFNFHLEHDATLCSPSAADSAKMDECKLSKLPDFKAKLKRKSEGEKVDMNSPDDFVLLNIRYGGPDLKSLESTFKTWDLPKIIKFMKECQRLFDGIVTVGGYSVSGATRTTSGKAFPISNPFVSSNAMERGGYILGDLKPNNFVYDDKIGRINFIDFGSLVEKSKHIEERLEKYNDLFFYFNFPLEWYYLLYANQYGVMPLKTDLIGGKIGATTFDDKPPMGQYEDVIKYVSNKLTIKGLQKEDLLLKRISDDFTAMVYACKKENKKENVVEYDIFVKLALDKADVYQLGFTMMSLLRNFSETGQIVQTKKKALFELFYSMMHPNLFSRIGPVEASQRYSELMSSWEIPKRRSMPQNTQQNTQPSVL
jgi:hypothetical protein